LFFCGERTLFHSVCNERGVSGYAGDDQYFSSPEGSQQACIHARWCG